MLLLILFIIIITFTFSCSISVSFCLINHCRPCVHHLCVYLWECNSLYSTRDLLAIFGYMHPSWYIFQTRYPKKQPVYQQCAHNIAAAMGNVIVTEYAFFLHKMHELGSVFARYATPCSLLHALTDTSCSVAILFSYVFDSVTSYFSAAVLFECMIDWVMQRQLDYDKFVIHR